MAGTTAGPVQRTVQKSYQWLHDLAADLSVDERTAWRFLRGYLQLLRDRLTVDEAAQLAAQLPHLLRGVFYEGFDPSRQPERIRDREAFLAALRTRAQLTDGEEAESVAAGVTRVLRRHITEGEFADLLAQLPAEIRGVLVPR
jgi:uncharacterized protein (DUF2267 family)